MQQRVADNQNESRFAASSNGNASLPRSTLHSSAYQFIPSSVDNPYICYYINWLSCQRAHSRILLHTHALLLVTCTTVCQVVLGKNPRVDCPRFFNTKAPIQYARRNKATRSLDIFAVTRRIHVQNQIVGSRIVSICESDLIFVVAARSWVVLAETGTSLASLPFESLVYYRRSCKLGFATHPETQLIEHRGGVYISCHNDVFHSLLFLLHASNHRPCPT